MTTITTRSSSRRLTQPPSTPETSSKSRRQPKTISSSDSEDDEAPKTTINTSTRRPANIKTTPHKTAATKSQRRLSTTNDLHEISPVTPPKQKKRGDNNDENALAMTPLSLLNKLAINSPPPSSISINRKKLFADYNNKDTYQNARRALHSTFPTDMPGRENELTFLTDFIVEHTERETSGTVYVSGPPGTGKTASLNMILQDDKLASKFKEVYVNCTAIKSSGSIYSRIVKDLGIVSKGKKSEKDNLALIENYLKGNHQMILLILDEIDQLESKNQSILYTIFEWPAKPNSKLILVGIANALDLTDRILPRLQARCELKPKLLHFSPYTKQQIVNIFTTRLKDAGVLDVFSPIALQMLAGKVAAISGDVRRALDIGRRLIELVDQTRTNNNTTAIALKSVENLASDLIDDRSVDELKTVDLKQVVNVLNSVYGTSQNLSDDVDDCFPLQQKIVVCSLLLILKKGRNKDVTVGRLHGVYRKVCSKRNLLAVDQSEFVGLCSLIETRGIIKVTGRKEARLNKVNLEWDEDEVASILKDKQLISSILQDDSCLGKL